jgi:hypothetical protein
MGLLVDNMALGNDFSGKKKKKNVPILIFPNFYFSVFGVLFVVLCS